MTHTRLYKHCLIFALIFITGLGLALALPWLANTQSLAAHSEVGEQGNTPEDVTIYYVAKTGDGTNPTDGWSTAVKTVQDALALAAITGGEIWVVGGVYYPDEGFGQINNAVSSTFVMTDNVTLYGGVPVQRILDTRADSFMETFRLVD